MRDTMSRRAEDFALVGEGEVVGGEEERDRNRESSVEKSEEEGERPVSRGRGPVWWSWALVGCSQWVVMVMVEEDGGGGWAWLG